MSLFKRKKNIVDEEKKPFDTPRQGSGQVSQGKDDTRSEKSVALTSAPQETASKGASAADAIKLSGSTYDIARVLRRPRITEKATLQAEKRVYVFEVASAATKKSIAEAVKRFYKVTPVKVNVTKIPAKKFFLRARRQKGVKTGGKKAYVYLKKGDKIEVV